MDSGQTISTWEVLQDFGFTPDATVLFSDIKPGLSFNFGNFKLSASAVMSKWFEPVVLFTGVLATGHSISAVDFQLPRMLASREQLAALLAYYLDNSGDDRIFRPTRTVDWLIEGRNHRDLLPWVAKAAAYQAPPHCNVPRDWLRLALGHLKEILSNADDAGSVNLSFDGSILVISCCGQVLAMAAKGEAWPSAYTIPAGSLRCLPRRIMQPVVAVSIFQDRLWIGRTRYSGVHEKTA